MSFLIGICWVKSNLSKPVCTAFHQQLTKSLWYQPACEDWLSSFVVEFSKDYKRTIERFSCLTVFLRKKKDFDMYFLYLYVSFGWTVSTNPFFFLPGIFIPPPPISQVFHILYSLLFQNNSYFLQRLPLDFLCLNISIVIIKIPHFIRSK